MKSLVAKSRFRLKPALALLGTFLLGMLVGALILSALTRHRVERIRAMRTPAGFVERMERVIQPESEAQRAAIRPLLEEAGADVHRITRSSRQELRATLRELRADLAPLLTEEQQARLARRGGFGRRGPPPLHNAPDASP